MSRVGKIARLPEEIREQLNRRLADGEAGSVVLPWLEGLPGVQAEVCAEKLVPRKEINQIIPSSPRPSPPQVGEGEGDRSAHTGLNVPDISGALPVSLTATGQPAWRPFAASCSKSHHYFFRAMRAQETGFGATSSQRCCLPSYGKNVCRGSPFHGARHQYPVPSARLTYFRENAG
jgi:hypothetical protein